MGPLLPSQVPAVHRSIDPSLPPGPRLPVGGSRPEVCAFCCQGAVGGWCEPPSTLLGVVPTLTEVAASVAVLLSFWQEGTCMGIP